MGVKNPASQHPPMPCAPPCLVTRPCLYSAQEGRSPKSTCGRVPTRAQGDSSPLFASAQETAHGRDTHVWTLCRDSL
jgi:hypothetical protein